jgi:hypothetical protein
MKMNQLKKTQIILTEKDYSIMEKEISRTTDALKERKKGTHSQEIELALTQLQEAILKVDKNFSTLISDLTGDPPEDQIRTENQDIIKETVQVPLLVVLRETPDQLIFMTQKLMEIDKRIEYVRGMLIGNLC